MDVPGCPSNRLLSPGCDKLQIDLVALTLNAKKDLSSVHPIKQKPRDKEDGRAMEHGFVGLTQYSEHVGAEVRGEIPGKKIVK